MRVEVNTVDRTASRGHPPIVTEALLLSVIEQMKMPLMAIARTAELARLNTTTVQLREIETTADAALQLLDMYLTGVRLATNQASLSATEPVATSAVMYDAAQRLWPLARLYNVELEVQPSSRYGPVITSRRGLEAALVSLGYALIEALPAQGAVLSRLELATHRCRHGLVIGAYGGSGAFTSQVLRSGRQLMGQARQPLTTVAHTSGAGIFVADAILQAMDANLVPSRHHRLYGLGTVLPLSPQLQLV